MRAQRGALSCVAFVTDDPAIQALLPQVLVASSRLVSASAAREFQEGRRDRIFLLRRNSSWLDGKTLSHIIRLLAACLEPVAGGRFFILSMDACPTHTTPIVLRTIANVGLHFHLIPASATRWMQPCDVAVFSALKLRVRQHYFASQARRGKAELDMSDVLCIFATALAEVLQNRCWSRAFALAGLHDGPPLSQRFRFALGEPALAVEEPAPPTLADLQCVFPARRTIPVDLLFRSLLHPAPVGGGPRPEHPRAGGLGAEGAHGAAGPWVGRLRSSAGIASAPVAAAPALAPHRVAARRAVPIGHRLGSWSRPAAPGHPL